MTPPPSLHSGVAAVQTPSLSSVQSPSLSVSKLGLTIIAGYVTTMVGFFYTIMSLCLSKARIREDIDTAI